MDNQQIAVVLLLILSVVAIWAVHHHRKQPGCDDYGFAIPANSVYSGVMDPQFEMAMNNINEGQLIAALIPGFNSSATSVQVPQSAPAPAQTATAAQSAAAVDASTAQAAADSSTTASNVQTAQDVTDYTEPQTVAAQ